jgi:hypothetical protein
LCSHFGPAAQATLSSSFTEYDLIINDLTDLQVTGMQNTANIFLALQLPKSENNCDTTIFFNNITLLSEDS